MDLFNAFAPCFDTLHYWDNQQEASFGIVEHQLVNKGILKDVFLQPISTNTKEEIICYIKKALCNYIGKIVKVNISLGFLLKHKLTREAWLFDSTKNKKLFHIPKLIKNGLSICVVTMGNFDHVTIT